MLSVLFLTCIFDTNNCFLSERNGKHFFEIEIERSKWEGTKADYCEAMRTLFFCLFVFLFGTWIGLFRNSHDYMGLILFSNARLALYVHYNRGIELIFATFVKIVIFYIIPLS